MAVGVENLPEFLPISGIRLGVANAGVKQTAKPDTTIIALAETAAVAGVFTKNAFCAAPVQIAKKHLEQSPTRYLLINTGNANAGTGKPGMQAAINTVAALAEKVAVDEMAVLPFSTGVIGELLPDEKIINACDAALADLSEEGWAKAANAIMTTDTRAKGYSVSVNLPDCEKPLVISGISKGSGMIKPNMATMLAYVAIDAGCSKTLLQRIVSEACDLSFNAITVDGDTSTNDSAILMAAGSSGLNLDELSQADLAAAIAAINEAFIKLAQLIIKDGEGATKFVHVVVEQGRTVEECRQLAFTVAESPLVKTALFASDANWGRILAAAGRAGLDDLDVEQVELLLNGVLIAENGARAASYTEEAGSKVMAEEEIIITLKLNRGSASATVWTSDLSHDYVSINADYRS